MSNLTVKTRLVTGEGTVINTGSETTIVMYCTGDPHENHSWEAITLPPFTHWKLEEIGEDEYDNLHFLSLLWTEN
jgi:hypothetical protein